MMTLDEMIGARLAVGIPGPDATDEVVEALRATHAQSLVVFTRNFVSPEQFAQLMVGIGMSAANSPETFSVCRNSPSARTGGCGG